MLDALSTAQVRVPRVTLASTDAEIFGAPFYLMERQDGEVIRTSPRSGSSARPGVSWCWTWRSR